MKALIKLSVLSISLLIILSGSVVSPALGEIKDTFLYEDPFLIKMILTLPSIVLIPFSLLSGRLSLILSKRTLLIIGLSLYTIGGTGGGIWENIYVMLAFRGILGVGLGVLIPLATSLIADFYNDDERRKMMGYSSSVSNLGGIIATLVSGWLATINWRFAFVIYSIALVVLALIVFALPEPPKTIRHDSKKSFNFQVILLSILSFFLNVAFFSFLTNIAIFLKEENIGKSDSAGLASSFLTLAGFLSGLFVKNISDYLKSIEVPFAIGCMGVGFMMLSDAYNLLAIYSSSFLIGLGLGILKPIILIKTTEISPKYSNSLAISIVSSSMFFGKFMSPFILDFISDMLNNSNTRFMFYFLGVALIIAGLLSFIIVIYPSKLLKLIYTR